MDALRGMKRRKKTKTTQVACDCFCRSRQEHLFSPHPHPSSRAGERQRVNIPSTPPTTQTPSCCPTDTDEVRVSERRRRAKPATAPYYPLNGGGLITVTMTDGLVLDRWDES